MSRCLEPLICPHCETPFVRVAGSLRCQQGHLFDIAREGYVNLLVGGKKRPKFLGDGRAMLQARRRFLEAGYFAPLADRIGTVAQTALGESLGSPSIVLDAGCGEGYYLGQIAQAVAESVCYFGSDIAKEAARLAAKQYPDAQFVVADSKKRLPFAAGTVQLLLNIFAPRQPAEFARLLGKNGRLLIVIPAADHLLSLRQQFNLLNIEPDKEATLRQQLAPWFNPVHQETIQFPLTLTGQALPDLIQMSPNARHLDDKQQMELTRHEMWKTAVSCRLLLFEKS